MNGPLGLPLAASAHAGEVDHTMVLVHILMAVLFVGWILFFVFALYRFRRKRNPVADYRGVTSHTSTHLEIAVAVVEAVLLIGFRSPSGPSASRRFLLRAARSWCGSWASSSRGTSTTRAPTASSAGPT